jgi:hypothetical protein
MGLPMYQASIPPLTRRFLWEAKKPYEKKLQAQLDEWNAEIAKLSRGEVRDDRRTA